MCEESVSLRNLELNRLSLFLVLERRYTKPLAERILTVLEDHFQSLHRLNLKRFSQIVLDILAGGEELYKKLLFECINYSSGGAERLCEHNLFAIMETFRQKDSYFFYKELLDRKEIPRDYNNILDDSDATFFEAFAPDLKQVAHSLDFKKRLVGVFDSEQEKDMCNEAERKMYATEEEFCRDVVSQILFVANQINSKPPVSPACIADMVEALANCDTLLQLRAALIEVAYKHKAIRPRAPRLPAQAISDMKRKSYDNERTKEKLLQTIAQNAKGTVCLGPDVNWRTGKKVSGCVQLGFDDFRTLVHFK